MFYKGGDCQDLTEISNKKKSKMEKIVSCPPKKGQKKEDDKNSEDPEITVDSTKEQVFKCVEPKLNSEKDKKKLKKIIDDEIDGEAFILIFLTGKDLKKYGIRATEELSKMIEKDIFKSSKNINENQIYKEIFEKEFEALCNSLDEKLKGLKYGESLKYIKYLIIKHPPPDKENKDDLKKYLNELLTKKDIIDDILDDFDDILSCNSTDFLTKCNEWELIQYDIYKLKILVEFIKTNKNNNNNLIDKVVDTEKNKDNVEAAPNLYEANTITDEGKDEYYFYCVVEVFEYMTSQRDIAYGMKNPIEEFERICKDFNIHYENECEKIIYKEADKNELSSVMIWGTKEGIYSFLLEKNIKILFEDFMKNNDNENKAGIYLCINKQKKIGYLIIWTGKFSYQYSNVNETNDSMLLTLIRYGFYLSSNSILCLTKEEIDSFNSNGYEIFQDNTINTYNTERNRVELNENIDKIFIVEEKKELTEGIEQLNDKTIIESRINQNILIFLEESKNDICNEINDKNCNEFSRNESRLNLYFKENFIINDPESFYLIIRRNPFFKEKNNDKDCYCDIQSTDIFEEKLNVVINDIFKIMIEDLFNDNKCKCIYCHKSPSESPFDLFFECNNDNSIKNFFHEKCYKENNNNQIFNYFLFNENKKYEMYEEYKKKILENNYIIGKKLIKGFFNDFENNIHLSSGSKNAISIDDNKSFYEKMEVFKSNLLKNKNIKKN